MHETRGTPVQFQSHLPSDPTHRHEGDTWVVSITETVGAERWGLPKLCGDDRRSVLDLTPEA